ATFTCVRLLGRKNCAPMAVARTVSGRLEIGALSDGKSSMSGPRWRLAVLLCLILWSAPVLAQSGSWESLTSAGTAAYQSGNFPTAEMDWLAAAGIAEQFGPSEPLLAKSLTNIADLYRQEGRYTEAKPIYTHVLEITEKAEGLEQLGVAHALQNLANLLL